MYYKARFLTLIPLLLLSALDAAAELPVVADSLTRMPLGGASVFDRRGNVAGICRADGRLPYVAPEDYPLTVRCLGYNERSVIGAGTDTIFLSENFTELPEVVVESRRQKVLQMLAYVREYSTLTNFTDTVFLFREKMVDYMLPADGHVKFRGWSRPRVLTSRSYYRFTDAHGLDSVSDMCSHHFSWSDWVGVVPVTELPADFRRKECATDTVHGKYSPTEIWSRNAGRVTVDVDVMADTTSRKWVPNLSAFFRKALDFEQFRVRFNFADVTGSEVVPHDLTGYSYNIESNGRGHDMFMFNSVDNPAMYVRTYAEVYVIEKKYLTVKEARKLERYRPESSGIGISSPPEAPALEPAICELKNRVDNIDTAPIRLAIAPDRRLIGHKAPKQNFGQRFIQLLKNATGITSARTNRNQKRHWREFRRDRLRENRSRGGGAEE